MHSRHSPTSRLQRSHCSIALIPKSQTRLQDTPPSKSAEKIFPALANPGNFLTGVRSFQLADPVDPAPVTMGPVEYPPCRPSILSTYAPAAEPGPSPANAVALWFARSASSASVSCTGSLPLKWTPIIGQPGSRFKVDSAVQGGKQSGGATLQNSCLKVSLVVAEVYAGAHLPPDFLGIVEKRQRLFAL